MSITDELDRIVDDAKEPEPESSAFTLDDLDGLKPIYFDIETGPEPDDVLEKFFEFDETKVKGHVHPDAKLDKSAIRYGNSGPEKRAEKLASEERKFNTSKVESGPLTALARYKAWLEFVDKAALSPVTGRVLAIGYGQGEDEIVLDYVSDDRSESQLLTWFWEVYRFTQVKRIPLIGFNSHAFDVPFLFRRSRKHGVEIPSGVLIHGKLTVPFRDILHAWQCGQYREYVKLNTLAKFFQVVEKTGDGAMFAKLFFGTPEEHASALAYLANDIDITMAVAKRLGQ